MALPGPFLAGQRLTAGQLNDATQKTLRSIEVSAAGSIGVTSGTTELNLAKLALGPVPQVNGGLYHFDLSLTCQNSVASDEYHFFLRRDTALTGTLITTFILFATSVTSGRAFVGWDDVTAAADENVQYYLSVKRVVGSGTLTVYGQLSSTNRSSLKISRAGYSSEFALVP